jgi:hypothetical protein
VEGKSAAGVGFNHRLNSHFTPEAWLIARPGIGVRLRPPPSIVAFPAAVADLRREQIKYQPRAFRGNRARI